MTLKYDTIIFWSVELLLCNDCKMCRYIRAVSEQRSGKHVPIARQQILKNATVGLQQWKSCVFCGPFLEVINEMRFGA
jgi:hypothetical protein